MAGEIKRAIDEIIIQRSKGIETLKHTTKTKLMLKGLNPDNYTENTPDDPVVLQKVLQIASELGLSITI
jgi:hypothetical protein